MARNRIEKRADRQRKDEAEIAAPHAQPGHTDNKSWDGRSTGNGGEGFSKGYGGSGEEGTGPSGAEDKGHPEDRGRSKT
ncbi:MAG: hypothetical protein EKK41_25505 [Hyphomicrobiales bacterium]|nr:MAG: hypothetical protein EKK41_25505 [Hyphomicrobiales bacterium]